MWRSSLLLALIVSSATSKSIPRTEDWKLALPKSSFVFQSHDRIVVASKNPNSLKLSYVDDDEFSCVVATNLESLTNGQVLGNGKFILFGRRSIVIVDPRDCSVEEVTKDYEKDSETQIVAYYETFDVFVPSECAPCRYDDRGQRVKLSYGLSTEGEKYASLSVKPIKEFDSAKGYFAVAGYENGTSVMRILDSKYGVKCEVSIDKEVLSAFVSKEGNIEVCSVRRRRSQRSSTCQLLGNDLRVIRDSGEHLSREKKFARLIVRPVSDDHLWKTISVFEKKDGGSNAQRSCLQESRPTGAGSLICHTVETQRFNLDVFVFADKACFSIVSGNIDFDEVEIKCLFSE